MCNFADDTTFYACDKDLRSLINRLEHDSLLAIEWFENNHMKLNQEKCHLLVSGYKHENIWARIGQTKIWESRKQKLLGVEIDSNLNFDLYVSSLCKKAGKKLSVLARLSSFMSLNQRRTLMKMFIESQFGYINTYMKGPYVLFINIILVPLKTYSKGINLSIFTIETFSHWL